MSEKNPTSSLPSKMNVQADLNGRARTEARRQKQRGRAIMAETNNVILSLDNRELQEQVDRLNEEKKELEEKLEATSALARTRFMDSKALVKTIKHLEAAWKVDAPNSKKYQETKAGLNEFYHAAFREVSASPEYNKQLEAEIKSKEEEVKARKRPRPRR